MQNACKMNMIEIPVLKFFTPIATWYRIDISYTTCKNGYGRTYPGMSPPNPPILLVGWIEDLEGRMEYQGASARSALFWRY